MAQLDPLHTFIAAFVIASLGGLAGLLHGNQELRLRNVTAAMLSSGLAGLILALLWYNWFHGAGNIYFLLGLAGLAGIGGMTAVDFIIKIFKGERVLGIDISFKKKKKKKKSDAEQAKDIIDDELDDEDAD